MGSEMCIRDRAKTWLLDSRAPKVEPPAAVKLLKEEGMQDA